MPAGTINLRELQAPLLENAEKYCVVLNTRRGGVPTESRFKLETR